MSKLILLLSFLVSFSGHASVICFDKSSSKFPLVVKLVQEERVLKLDKFGNPTYGNGPILWVGNTSVDQYYIGGINLGDMIGLWKIPVEVKSANGQLRIITDKNAIGSFDWAKIDLLINSSTGEGSYSGTIYGDFNNASYNYAQSIAVSCSFD